MEQRTALNVTVGRCDVVKQKSADLSRQKLSNKSCQRTNVPRPIIFQNERQLQGCRNAASQMSPYDCLGFHLFDLILHASVTSYGMSRRSVFLTTVFACQAWQTVNQFFVHILSLATTLLESAEKVGNDTVEIISRSISMEVW